MPQMLDLLAGDRLRLSPRASLEELKADIVRAALVEGEFVFSNGTLGNYYFDKYLFETEPAILRRLARHLAELVPQDTDRIAAPALGAVALGTALSLEIGTPLVVVRAGADWEPSRAIEGEVHASEGVTVIEDVVASGARAARTVEILRGFGVQTKTVVAAVDREEGAVQRLGGLSVTLTRLFSSADLGVVQ